MKTVKIFLVLILITSNWTVIAQTRPAGVNFPSPNVYSLGTYGNIPVNMFTGIPNISIPLYNLEYGSVKVPVLLNYHPSNVKANQHPGWTGLGWTLHAGGSITRVVKGNYPDEAETKLGKKNGFFNYYSKIAASDWYTV